NRLAVRPAAIAVPLGATIARSPHSAVIADRRRTEPSFRACAGGAITAFWGTQASALHALTRAAPSARGRDRLRLDGLGALQERCVDGVEEAARTLPYGGAGLRELGPSLVLRDRERVDLDVGERREHRGMEGGRAAQAV